MPQKALELAKQVNDKKLFGLMLCSIRKISYSDQSNYSASITNYFKQLNLVTELNDTLNTAFALGNIGI